MSGPPIFTTIAKYTFLEAIRDRLFLLLIVLLLCAFGLSQFIGALALTESAEIQLALLGSSLRLFTLFITSLFVVTSMAREFNDKGLQLILSHPVARSSYYIGKLTGFALIALALALLTATALAVYAPMGALLAWTLSLLCENLIIVALSILCAFTFNSATTAFATVFAFYLLARNIAVIQSISHSPILETNTLSQQLIGMVLDAIAWLLPNFHAFTRTEWLIEQNPPHSELLLIAGQTLIYLLFISGAALFDLYRKEL